MSNLITYPLIDGFQTTLSQEWNGAIGTIYVNDTPGFTFPVGVTTYIVVNPGKTNMQAAIIDDYDPALNTMDVSSITLNKGAGVAYTQQTHAVGSTVVISDNYQFWEDIKTAINSKSNIASPAFTGSVTIPYYADSTARDVAIPSPVNGMLVKTGTTYQGYNGATVQWEDFDVGTPPQFASTTVAGIVEIADQTEFDAGTNTGGTGATVVPTPSQIQSMVNTATAKTSLVDADLLLIGDSAAAGANKKITYGNLLTGIVGSEQVGDGSDGDATITTTITLTRDMFYNNLTITSPGILIPDGYRIYVRGTLSGNGKIQRNGNNGGNGLTGTNSPGSAGGVGATALNAGTLNADIAGVAGGDGGTGSGGTPGTGTTGTSTNPSYSNVASVGGGAGGGTSVIAGGLGGTSTRGILYNVGSLQNYFSLIGPASIFQNPTQYKGIAASGGGSGGRGNSSFGGGSGGGSGGNGGHIWLAANIINWTGTFESIGGTGGNGGAGGGRTAGGGGGGGGGNGGVVVVFYKTLTNIGSNTLTGGNGGAAGSGGGTAAVVGTNGNAGVLIQVAL